jgi:hypothetical protein
VRHEVDGEDPEARLRRRHVVARVVGDVVARARTEDEAFDALLASPSHRRALVDRRFTDVCVGTARRGASLCVVIDLAAWAALLGPLRSARGLPEALTSRTSLAARTRGRRRSVATDAAEPTTHLPDGRPPKRRRASRPLPEPRIGASVVRSDSEITWGEPSVIKPGSTERTQSRPGIHAALERDRPSVASRGNDWPTPAVSQRF